ncbi:MAG TPA: hypothetical protein PLY25_05865 [Bacteroidia bacterium]|nr:hypothetical protein [Bacteroidia bacterium]
MPYFGWDMGRIPGDLGDARFNYYILEHGYQYLTDQIHGFWDASSMYPYKNVIALSDNLIGTMPIYAIFRVFNVDRETSFQLWIIVLFLLNYWSCFYVLKKFGINNLIAASCAFIYGFGLYNHGQIFHIQVFPRFIAPLVIYWSIRFIQTLKSRYFTFLLLGLAYQFYCGIYLGFFLAYFIMFLFIAAFIVNLKLPFELNKKALLNYTLSIIGTIIVLLPLFLPYIHSADQVGTRSYEYSLNSLPRLRSYFFTSPASVTWNFLYPFTAFKFINWWNHLLFPGIIPWLGVVASPFVFIALKKNSENSKILLLIIITFVLSLIFCLNIKNYSLYKIIYLIPGFSSMRSVDRIMNIQILLFVLLTAFSLHFLIKHIRLKVLFACLLPILVLFDNYFIPEPHKSISKSEAQANVQYFKSIISEQYNSKYKAIAFFPVDLALTKAENKNFTAVSQTLSIMLACQDLHIKCVNGYSGFNPYNFLQFFEYPDSSSLKTWCNDNKISDSDIQIMNDFEVGGFYLDTMQIMTNDSLYWCLDKNYNDLIMANRKIPQSWETFLALKFNSGKTLISSLDQVYLKVDPYNKRLLGYKNSFLNSDLVNIEPYQQQRSVIKIYNKYATVDKETKEVRLTDEINIEQSTFEIKILK